MSHTGAGSVLTESLKDWQPGSAEMTRRVDPWPAEAFAGLIGAPLPPLRPGDPLPPMWHWFTLLDHPAQAENGLDGHPAGGPFLPPIPRRRRMFAGGRLRQDAPVPVGAELSSRSSVVGGATVGIEEQDIVYRSEPDDAAPRAVPRPATGVPEPAGTWRLELATDPILLFRFSALTYNAHRIHYDRPYAMQVEGYPDLVVHGPLLALELPRVHAPDRVVRAFEYRLVRPAFLPSRIVSLGSGVQPNGYTVEVTVGAEGAGPSLTARVGLE
jgi:3-methylfumaryl-CoA hydratase